MNECDELAAHILETSEKIRVTHILGICVRPELWRIERLIREVERSYDPRVDFGDMLDRILKKHILRTDAEHAYYKTVLGKVFGNRSAAKQAYLRAAGAARK